MVCWEASRERTWRASRKLLLPTALGPKKTLNQGSSMWTSCRDLKPLAAKLRSMRISLACRPVADHRPASKGTGRLAHRSTALVRARISSTWAGGVDGGPPRPGRAGPRPSPAPPASSGGGRFGGRFERRQRSLEEVQGQIDLVAGHDQRRGQPDRPGAGGQDQEPPLEGGGDDPPGPLRGTAF